MSLVTWLETPGGCRERDARMGFANAASRSGTMLHGGDVNGILVSNSYQETICITRTLLSGWSCFTSGRTDFTCEDTATSDSPPFCLVALLWSSQ
eukprot:3216475-Amphidinium_carterae.1